MRSAARALFFLALLAALISPLTTWYFPVQAQSAASSVVPIGKPVQIKTPLGLPPVPIPADNPPTEETISLGRRLYYDPHSVLSTARFLALRPRPRNLPSPTLASFGGRRQKTRLASRPIVNSACDVLPWLKAGGFSVNRSIPAPRLAAEGSVRASGLPWPRRGLAWGPIRNRGTHAHDPKAVWDLLLHTGNAGLFHEDRRTRTFARRFRPCTKVFERMPPILHRVSI